MSETSEDLRLILGLKLRNARLARGETIGAVAARAGLSISYLSELEQGKKYPKHDKLLSLARALGMAYDDLVSARVDDELGPLKEAVSSGFLRRFPFELFGIGREDLVRLISVSPDKTAALIQSLVDIGRSYDVQVEHFLLSALRSYQQMHANYFEEIEQAAQEMRRECGWPSGERISEQSLQGVLEQQWGYAIERTTLANHPELAAMRSVFIDGPTPTLHVNSRLLPVQQAFLLARELGYRRLGLEERSRTSSWIRIESFAEVLNNFKASYFAGALLMDRQSVGEELARLFRERCWDRERFLAIKARFGATPEMFLYRLTEVIPQQFGLERLFFLRFQQRLGTEEVALTKVFNLSGVSVPYGLSLKEHYCRRWPGLTLMAAPAGELSSSEACAVQRSRFIDRGAEFFVIALGRSLALQPGVRSTVTLGLLLDERCKRKVRFWNDESVARVDVNLTCERCDLGPDRCQERAAPPVLKLLQQDVERKERALSRLAGRGTAPARGPQVEPS